MKVTLKRSISTTENNKIENKKSKNQSTKIQITKIRFFIQIHKIIKTITIKMMYIILKNTEQWV